MVKIYGFDGNAFVTRELDTDCIIDAVAVAGFDVLTVTAEDGTILYDNGVVESDLIDMSDLYV